MPGRGGRYAPAKWEEHIKERFDKDYEHLKDVQNRKVTMETNWHKQVEFNYVRARSVRRAPSIAFAVRG